MGHSMSGNVFDRQKRCTTSFVPTRQSCHFASLRGAAPNPDPHPLRLSIQQTGTTCDGFGGVLAEMINC